MTTTPPTRAARRWFHPVFTTVTILVIVGISAWAWSGRGSSRAPGPVVAPPVVAPAPPGPQAAAPAKAASDAPAEVARLPVIAPEPQELHGVFRGERFWGRLLPAEKDAAGRRLLQLVYTPPSIAELDGAHLIDCPFVMLDAHARVVFWHGRDGLSNVHPYRAKEGYRVVREVPQGEGELASPVAVERRIPGPLAYDLRLAPVLLALSWRADSEGEVPVVDLFGPRFAENLVLRWHGGEATMGAETWHIEADDAGRLRRIVAADGTAIIEVMGRG